ncbi:MAG: NACHT domain-containing protein [Myxococcota bacterium]
MTASQPAQPLPAWLDIPPSRVPVLPTVSRLQALPYLELAWEDFERLVLRVARERDEIIGCRLYGVRGDDQHGIDLYARNGKSERYFVYQCKRVRSFTASDITAAVSVFMAGAWFGRAQTFVLCTATSLRTAALSEQVEVERARLREHGITFDTLDAAELDVVLKLHPHLVDDFFGRAMCEAFCGVEVSSKLARRLDGFRVVEFRKRMRDLYSALFVQHDPGLPMPPSLSDRPIPLRDRYVLPDVFPVEPAPTPRVVERARREGPWGDDTDARALVHQAGEVRTRQGLAAWLRTAPRCLLLGGPGSGKSSALRFVQLDLLSDAPVSPEIAAAWGSRLPVWISFPYWTALIARSPSGCSLPECVRRWLEQYGYAEVWPLVDEALADDRVLLLVDGLDEWSTPESAESAAHLLQVYVQARNLPVIAAGRPHGVKRLDLAGGGWRLAELAELSQTQQSTLVGLWLRHRFSSEATDQPQVNRLAELESARFLEQLRGTPRLGDLAQNPMLLLLLLYLDIHKSGLPGNRFEAMTDVLDHLITVHPKGRARAGLASQRQALDSRHVRDALARLAFILHRDHPSGVADVAVATSVMHAALGEDDDLSVGLATESAERAATELLEAAISQFGLLLRVGPAQVAFFHRSAQEHLAAHHAARLPPHEQGRLLQQIGLEPGWEHVVLALIWLSPSPAETSRLLSCLPSDVVGLELEQKMRLHAEVAFGPFQSPAPWRREAMQAVEREIEVGERLEQRQDLLQRLLPGIQDVRIGGEVQRLVSRWKVSRESWRAGTLAGVERWPRSPETWHVLRVALNDDDMAVQRAAGHAFAAVYGGDPEVGEALVGLAGGSGRPSTRAAALGALLRGWPSMEALTALLRSARTSMSEIVVLAAIEGRVERAEQDDDDLRVLLESVSGAWRTETPWSEAAPGMLASGWKGDDRLKAACLRSVGRRVEYGEGVRRSVAERLLLAAFPGDDDVAAYIADQLRSERFPFNGIGHGAWYSIARHFAGHPVVSGAAADWIVRQDFPEPQMAILASVAPTDRVRTHLLTRLSRSSFPHWAAGALLDLWGPGDGAVLQGLTDHLAGASPAAQSRIAHLLPRWMSPGECIPRLRSMLEDPSCMRPDLVLSGFAALDGIDREEVVQLALRHLDRGLIGSPLWELIHSFPDVPSVREATLRMLDTRDAPLSPAVRVYGDDGELRAALAECLMPAPVPLRAQIVDFLGRQPYADLGATRLLDDFDLEHDPELMALGASARARRATGQTIPALLDKLTAMVTALGPEYSERRRAGFVGLLAMGRLDVFTGLHDPFKDDDPLCLEVDALGGDRAFLRHVAERWTEIHEALGGAFELRMGIQRHGHVFWEALCRVAIEFPETHADVLVALSADEELATSVEGLGFLARVGIPPELLQERILAALDVADGKYIRAMDVERAMYACDLLLQRFAGDAHVAEGLAEDVQRGRRGRLAALCRGWPQHPRVTALYDEALATRRWAPGDRELLYARMPADTLWDRVAQDLEEVEERWLRIVVAAPLAARLARDADARALLHQTVLQGRASALQRAAIPTILKIAGGVTPDLERWCREEIVRQSRTDAPELGLDLRLGEVRGVSLALMDVIAS